MNIQFDDIDLSTLGFALHSTDGRSMAPWKVETLEIPGSDRHADISISYDQTSTTINGMLSADTDNYDLYTKAEFLSRLDALKAVLRPRKGFRRLLITADQLDRFRWARYQSMSFEETRPIRRPFHPISITFQNLEPYWRETNDFVTLVTPGSIANDGEEDTRPRVELTVLDTIAAYSGPVVQPVTLLQIDDLQITWKGTPSNGALLAGDVIIVDAESFTCTLRPRGVGSQEDVIRHYGYSGPGSYLNSGFPVIARGGSEVSYIHPRISSALFRFDRIYP